MTRRPAEMYSGDWLDVYCAVCHRRIFEGEWRDENEFGTMCWECHDRSQQMEDTLQPARTRSRHTYTHLHI